MRRRRASSTANITPFKRDVGGRIAVARFAQNGGLHTL
jgi:hypothetical protein